MLAVVAFDDLHAAIAAVPGLVQTDPCAVEVVSKSMIDIARGDAFHSKAVSTIDPDAGALLFVEYHGGSAEEVESAFPRMDRVVSDAGGTINLNLSRANPTRETTNVASRVDSYGGFRVSLDLNRPIIRNKLALRFSAVYNEVGYVRKPSVDRTNRQQIAVTYRPFRTTSINASYEFFHEWAQRANALTPRDTITNWRNNGRPKP